MRATHVHAFRPALAGFCVIWLTAFGGEALAQSMLPGMFGGSGSPCLRATGSPGLSLTAPGGGIGPSQAAPVQSPLNVPPAPQPVQAPAAAPSGGAGRSRFILPRALVRTCRSFPAD